MAKRTAEQSKGQLKLLPSREQVEEQIREELRTRMSASMLEVVYAIFEEQKELLCGKPWTRKELGQEREVADHLPAGEGIGEGGIHAHRCAPVGG